MTLDIHTFLQFFPRGPSNDVWRLMDQIVGVLSQLESRRCVSAGAIAAGVLHSSSPAHVYRNFKTTLERVSTQK